MDQPCSFEELRGCLRDISQVNRLTFAYRPTLHWLDYVYSVMPRQEKPLHIVDVGCGYGDMLRRIYEWAEWRRVPVVLTGIDLNKDAIRAAREVTHPGRVTYLAGDAYSFEPAGGIDIVVSSLMTHHMEDAEIVEFIRWMDAKTRIGWFINDLHRQAVPYRLFRALTWFTTWHRFVKHDGPVSILRSFRREDWLELIEAAKVPEKTYAVKEYKPARLCVARMKELGPRA
ncbi:methyltransferase domain-containing protein [Granulicella tundricola]|uniref:Methyltransferase type 11 n=1 Tax=Granulicella tundricola (strain ATCC BAA-1859 / DSM 23138 / MP5ACTX9) TaxID=1198114 RepID=E8WXH9_GRATM|nr:methyltransferase domain-containing protein [Granulicella tundricola]ADW67512.1 Methyltransferase type 11 [Granulicella tundricola MP5ACTX9]